MLTEGHIFTIKTKDPKNVDDIQNVSTNVTISGLNVLRDFIRIGDLVFVVFGGDKPSWKTGLVGLAQISSTPFDDGYDGKKNFRVRIDIKTYFDPIVRGDLVSYPETFDTIGISPITKWEPNQAITSVSKDKAIALLQAICELRPNVKKDVESLLGEEFSFLSRPVKRYVVTTGKFGDSNALQQQSQSETNNGSATGKDYLFDVALKLFAEKRLVSQAVGGKTYDEIYAEVRAEASRIDGDYLVSCDYEAFRKTLNSAQVANSFFSRHTDDDKRRLGDFIAVVRQDPRDISFYLMPGNQPNVSGVGPAMLTAFLTRTRPDLFVFFTEQMFESVKFLGLTTDDALPALSTDAYNTYRGIQTAIRDRMREMGIRAENGNDADYLTVNEFTWFVSENKDLIKEQVMKKQWKPVNSQAKKKTGSRKLSDAFANDDMLKRLAAALRTKPFAILAGHSGTGKSQLVRRLAYMTCNNELLAKEGEGKTAPGNYCMVQVKPNWHDSTDLLGYYSEMGGRHFVNTPFVEFICKAYAYPDTPFFVCLDEMNLAPVEQYFAEYLSAIESLEKKGAYWVTDPLVEVDRDGEKADSEILCQIMKGAESTEAAEWIQAHGLTIPKNLFVIGTVNMDETTCQFSRKVLDRAMTLLMNTVSFADMATGKKPSEEELLDDDGVKFFLEGDVRGEVGKTESGLLDGINEPLKNTAFVVAYRFANEYALYEAAWAKLMGVDWATATDGRKKSLANETLDHVVLMKLLPRIHGERRVVEGIFKGRKVKGANGDKDLPGLKAKVLSDGLSAKMMDAILARPDEYLTFWP